MYTQCPDCATSFRVTAEVLKQAAGKVRCGGCGNAFNALAYLSESKPESKSAPEPGEALPELKPDPYEGGSEDAPPAAISPEQSAALLKTLDELAGDDIRLEDTGIEWRLMAEEEDAGSAATATASAGDQNVDEMLDASPTPVDQFLTQTPNEVEAGEVFDAPDAVADDIEIIGEAEAPQDEVLRFDDNTGLPDDFDFDSVSEPEAPAPQAPPEPVEPEPHPQVDLALGDPDEWGELLSEAVIEPETGSDDGPSIIEELEALEAEISTDAEPAPAEAPAKSDAPLDIDTQFDLQAEALGLDFDPPETPDQAAHETADSAAEDSEATPTEPDPTETSIEDDLIAAAFEAEQAAAAALEASGLQLSLDDEDDEESIIDDLSALDDEPSIEEELAALDGSAAAEDYDPFADDEPSIADELIGRDAVHASETPETEEEFPDSTGALEFELAEAAAAAEKAEVAEVASEAAAEEASVDEASEDDIEAAALDTGDETPEPEEDDIAAELALLDDDEAVEPELSLDDDAALTEDLAEAAEAADHDVPEQSEEEQTINAMIDEDLMRLAIEDEDGFASTIVFEKQAKSGKKVETEPAAKKESSKKPKSAKADEEADLETESDIEAATETPADAEDEPVEAIIMEGSFARTAEEQQRIEESTDEETGKPAFLAASDDDGERGSGGSLGRRVAMIGGTVALLLGLGGQFVHQSRAELATIPAVNNVIGPIYRALGMPITPEWDVSAWRFEVTRGSTGDFAAQVDEVIEGTEEPTQADVADDSTEGEEAAAEDEVAEASGPETLTIYSRIGNESSQSLPYPLVSVSLTDRFEETIGNVVLEPAEYLTGNFDPRRLVPAGETFDAVISIESPSMEATGFKLNVCYRQDGGLLRCAIEDFK